MPLTLDCLLHVLRVCDTRTLVACGQTCMSFRGAATNELHARVAILLAPFFRDRVRHFLGLLRLHNAIISGSTSLALFMWPVDWVPGDLDVYVGESAYVAFVLDFERLFPVTLEADLTRRYPGTYNGIKRVRRYSTPGGRRLELIQSRSHSAVSPLLYFWSSLVVNFITSTQAVCAYPIHTLTGSGFIAAGHPAAKTAAARKKYERRGCTFSEIDFWRVGGDRWKDDNRIFSNDPLMVIGFHSAWSAYSANLPIVKSGSDWIVKPAQHRDQPGTPSAFRALPDTVQPSVGWEPLQL